MSVQGASDRGIDRLPSGRFRLRLQLEKRGITKTFATREEARNTRDAILREYLDGTMIAVDGASVALLGPHFLRSRSGNRAYEDDRYRWNAHIATAAFANRAVSLISRGDVLRWLADLKDKTARRRGREPKPLSHQSRKHCLNLLRGFFKWALDYEHVTSNPCSDVVIKREDGDEDDGYQPSWFLNVDEQRELLDAAGSEEKWIIAFAMGTGLRLNELNCLQLEDVHLGDDVQPHIVVKYGSWDPRRKRYLSPKGRKGEKRERIVPLFGLALEAAIEWRNILPKYAEKNPLKLMFPTRRGARRSKPPRSWGATVDAFGVVSRIGKKVWWHLLRHTCASSLVAGWWGRKWTLDEIRTFLGHSTVKVTERYAHLANSVVHDVATMAEAAWRGHGRHSVVMATQKPRAKWKSNSPSKPVVDRSNRSGRAETRNSCVPDIAAGTAIAPRTNRG